MAKRVKVDIDGVLNIVLKASGFELRKHSEGHPQFQSFVMVGDEYTKLTRAVDEHRETLRAAGKSGVVIEEDI